MSDVILETRNLTKKYGRFRALDNVSVSLKKNHIYGFIGENGAGKSTFMKIISGLVFPTSGDYSLMGADDPKEIDKKRKQVGTMIEEPALYPKFTVHKNVELQRLIVGNPDASYTDKVLELVGLAGVKTPFKGYSLGMKQRLGIANAILGSPEILILDEPTNGLDPQGIADVRHMIRRFNEEFGMTVIVSSHILGELEHTADRFGIINDGIVVKEISQDDLKEKDKAVEIAVDDLEKAKQLLAAGGVKVLREVEERSTLEDFYFHLIGGGGE